MQSANARRVDRLDTESKIDPQCLDHPVLAFLKSYWEGKRRGRPIPSRRDIDPAEMKPYLPWLVLVDVLADHADFRFRLIGTLVTQYFAKDCTGRLLTDAFGAYGETAVKGAMAVHRKVARDHVPVLVSGNAGWLGKDFLEFSQLLLPLGDDGTTCNMILSAFTFDHRKHWLRRAPGLL